MKIRNKLYLIFSMFLVLFAMIGLTIFWANKQINQATAKTRIANGINHNLNELNIVTYEYLLYHEKRTQQQWHIAYSSASKFLQDGMKKLDSPAEVDILESISKDLEAIRHLFEELETTYKKSQRLSRENVLKKEIADISPLEAIWISQLLVESHQAAFGSLKLHAMAQQEMLQSQHKAGSVIIITTVIFLAILLITGALTIRSIAIPISRLVEGTHVIGKGNFNHKIDIKSGDEIGELTASFNTMAQNLLDREMELRKSEARYRSLTDDVLDSSEVGIFILDSDFKVIWVNQSLERYFGIRRDEIIGKDKRRFIRKRIMDIFEDPESFAKKVFATYDNNTYVENFECHVLPDGKLEERWLEHWSQPIGSGLYAGGRIEHYYDITESKRAEEEIHQYLNELIVLHQASVPFSQSLTVEAVGQKIIEVLERLLSWRRGSIWLRSQSGQELHLFAHSEMGLSSEIFRRELNRVRGLVSQLGQGISGWVALHGKPVRISDIKNDPRYIEADPTIQSELCVPLQVSGRTIGAINVESPEPNAFNEHDERLLTTLANQAAIAIENARLFGTLQQELTEHRRTAKRLHQYQEQLRSLASELTLAEERERRRIGEDLHDGIAQTLAISKIKLAELQEMANSTEFIQPLDKIQTMIDQAVKHTRSLIFEISSPILYELGFEAAVEWLTEHFSEQHGIPFNFEDDKKDKSLDDHIRIFLFKALQELLINIVKHAKATTARICIRRKGENIEVLVEDDGRGFNVSKTEYRAGKTGGFGLFNIRERLDYHGGTFEIQSEPGRGTKVILQAPLKGLVGKQKNHEYFNR